MSCLTTHCCQSMVEVVGQGDAVPLSNLEDLVFAVTVESGPLNGRLDIAVRVDTPVEHVPIVPVAHYKLTSFVVAG
jgi:hypothetical protein